MYVAESKRLTHQGAKKIMMTAVDMANQAGISISCAIVDAGGHMILLERMDGLAGDTHDRREHGDKRSSG